MQGGGGEDEDKRMGTRGQVRTESGVREVCSTAMQLHTNQQAGTAQVRHRLGAAAHRGFAWF